MATNYNVYDSAFANKQVMENSDYANSTAPSKSTVHGIECDVHERPTPLMYIETPPGGSLQLSTMGNFQIATQGMSVANVNVGELWVSYDITFYKKQLSSNLSLASFWQATASAVSGGSPLVSPVITTGSSPYFTTSTVIGTGVYVYFPPSQSIGTYMVYYTLTTASAAVPAFTANTGCTVTANQAATAAAGRCSRSATINLTGTGASFLMPTATTSTTCALTIVPVSLGLVLL
jgi:hypothetical protein